MARDVSQEGGILIRDIAGESDEWRDLAPGIQVRLLRACQATGTWSVLYKVKAGTTAAAHMHYGSADSFVLKGKMRAGDKNGKTLSTGDYTFEPNNHRHHPGTYFEEDTLLLYIHTGPLMYLDEAGKPKTLVDWEAMLQFAEKAPAAS